MTDRFVLPLDQFPEPLELFERFAHLPYPALLDTSAREHELGRYSYLSADPVAVIRASADEWPEVREQLRAAMHHATAPDPALPPFQGGWIGWFGYELASAFDHAARAAHDPLELPDVALALYDWVLVWDHLMHSAWLISSGVDAAGVSDAARARSRLTGVVDLLAQPTARQRRAAEGSVAVTPDFTPAGYRAAITTTIEHVLAGDIFQANIAQRFTAPYHGDPVVLYRRLRAKAPAPFGAYLDFGDVQILSASPERFLMLDGATGAVETRPIKGTRPRAADPVRDRAMADELQTSAKDRAENVMIVDLLRNDLARVCRPGTIAVPALCTLESHQTVHHLVSTVTGTLRPGRDALDLLAATFPSGSITGAPKLRAMAIIAEQEPVTRGAYCGAIGWLGLDGSLSLNVAIRTMTVAHGVASLHAGGGITALSDPEAEYQETLDKARALVAALEEG